MSPKSSGSSPPKGEGQRLDGRHAARWREGIDQTRPYVPLERAEWRPIEEPVCGESHIMPLPA